MSADRSEYPADRLLFTLTGFALLALSLTLHASDTDYPGSISVAAGLLVATMLVAGLGVARGSVGRGAVGATLRTLSLWIASSQAVAWGVQGCISSADLLIYTWKEKGGLLGLVGGWCIQAADFVQEKLIGLTLMHLAGSIAVCGILALGLLASLLGLSRRSPVGVALLATLALIVLALNWWTAPWNAIRALVVLSGWGLVLQPSRRERDVQVSMAVLSILSSLTLLVLALTYALLPFDDLLQLAGGPLAYAEDLGFLAIALRLTYLSFRDATRVWRIEPASHA